MQEVDAEQKLQEYYEKKGIKAWVSEMPRIWVEPKVQHSQDSQQIMLHFENENHFAFCRRQFFFDHLESWTDPITDP